MRTFKIILFILLPMTSFGQTYRDHYDNGQIAVEITDLDKTPDVHRHITCYHENGQKKEEFFDKHRTVYDTLNKWTEEGQLHYRGIYSDTGYIEIRYSLEIDQIIEIGNYKLVQSPGPEMLVYDSAKFDIYETAKCYDQCYERTGVWMTYHINGQLESEGQYLPTQFQVAYPTQKDSTDVYEAVPNTSFDRTSIDDFVLCTAYLKDGLWMYYDQNGNEVKEERYEKGLLISK